MVNVSVPLAPPVTEAAPAEQSPVAAKQEAQPARGAAQVPENAVPPSPGPASAALPFGPEHVGNPPASIVSFVPSTMGGTCWQPVAIQHGPFATVVDAPAET